MRANACRNGKAGADGSGSGGNLPPKGRAGAERPASSAVLAERNAEPCKNADRHAARVRGLLSVGESRHAAGRKGCDERRARSGFRAHHDRKAVRDGNRHCTRCVGVLHRGGQHERGQAVHFVPQAHGRRPRDLPAAGYHSDKQPAGDRPGTAERLLRHRGCSRQV